MAEAAFVQNAFEIRDKKCAEKRMHELIEAKQAVWRKMIDKELPLFEGIDGVVEKMSHEFSLGIVSMAPSQEIDLVLDKAGLSKFFTIIVSAEDVLNCKPDPECYRLGFKRLDVARTMLGHLPMTHGECVVIEDSPPGVQAA